MKQGFLVQSDRGKSRYRKAAFLGLLGALALGCMGIFGCDSGAGNADSHELEEIRLLVANFLEQAYNAGGDVEGAYALLDAESQTSCPFDRFERMTEIARAYLDRDTLRVESISDLKISGETATLRLLLSGDNMSPPFFPRNATVRREDGHWRYVITKDPSCQDVFRFFDWSRGVQATPAIYDDPACENSYPLFCVSPPPPDLDCKDIEEEKPFVALPPDPHGFDTDGDGFGCEANQPGEP